MAVRAMTDFDLASLAAELRAWGFKESHGRKLMQAFYEEPGGREMDAFTGRDLGHALEAMLRKKIVRRRSDLISRHESDDGTVKLLLGLERGGAVEAVLMPAYRADRAGGCVSSQIGRGQGC